MSVIGPDNRQILQPALFGTFPYSTVAAIDIDGKVGFGSGIVVAPNYVLSAAHNADSRLVIGLPNQVTDLRITTSIEQPNLNLRVIGVDGDPPANVDKPYIFLADYDKNLSPQNDIALFKTTNNLLNADKVMGLIAFVDPQDATGEMIETAGYPTDNSNIPGNSQTTARALVSAKGIIEGSNAISTYNYSPTIDTAGGQSGSGIWHNIQGDTARVLGVHTQGSFLNNQRNSGVLITTDIYINTKRITTLFINAHMLYVTL